ncbi:dual specificity tyrosine-phosphorylation-regulated kinase 4-like [Colossoma macropomum]|uniref:dual specificity tyrosine-phosphorylation-regulated kinase 4-like n=1 Tax=Colossoma macropomum TaxID=42526 RepID=UPI00186480A4|nr:dual specificity tyrosine-phosphorylation-regulated kinase 4-like [Colossoma macropomum]
MFPEINSKGGKPDALPQQLNKLYSENARLGSARPSKLSNGTGVGALPKLNSKPQSVHPAKSNFQLCGTLPHISDKRQPNNLPVQQGRLHEKTLEFKSTRQNLSECIDTKSPFNKQECERLLEGYALPMAPTDVLKYFGKTLTGFEQDEVLDYSEIWYLGLNSKKIDGSLSKDHNSGYDDESGTYKNVIHDHIAYRYEVLDMIGKGSFGQVFKCLDHRTNEMVAIKIIRNKKRFHQQAMVELKILDVLRRKDRGNSYNVIHMKDYFYFRNHLCITFELLGPNLYELVKKNRYHGLSQALVCRIAQALLKCLQMLKKEKIIHCDLKPENILLSPKGQGSIKVIDFGSSCYEHQRVYTYIQSRFYRSPEVIMGQPYTSSIDMWSLGCILAELYTGLPLFPGENEAEQIACMMEVLGLPPTDFLQTSSRRKLFFDFKGNPRNIINSKGLSRMPSSKDLAVVLKTNDQMFLDFIKRCLRWDPNKRLTPEEAMRHAWIQDCCHKSRPKTRPLRNSSMDTHTGLAYLKAVNNRAGEKSLFNGSEKSRKELSSQVKPMSAERCRPLRASAVDQNEEGCVSNCRESSGKQGSSLGGHYVHIIIEPPEDITNEPDCQEQF